MNVTTTSLVSDSSQRGDIVIFFAFVNARKRFYKSQGDSRTAQIAERCIRLCAHVRIEYGTIGKFVSGLMMVCDQHVQSQFVLSIIDFLHGIDAAIYAYHYLRVGIFGDIVQSGNAYAVTVAVTVGNKVTDFTLAVFGKISVKYRDRTYAVTVIIAVYNYALSVGHRSFQPVGNLVYAGIFVERRERRKRRVEKSAGFFYVVYPSGNKQVSDQSIYREFFRQY